MTAAEPGGASSSAVTSDGTLVRLVEGTVEVEQLRGPVGIAHIGTQVAQRSLASKSVRVSSKLLKHATTNPKSGPLPAVSPKESEATQKEKGK